MQAISIQTCATDPARQSSMNAATKLANWWSIKLGNQTTFVPSNQPFMILSPKFRKQIEILCGDRKGWINYESWLKLRKISK